MLIIFNVYNKFAQTRIARFLMLMMRLVCHFDGGEISTRSSTKIGFSLRSFLRRFLLRRNDKTDENILMETSALAQIEVKSPELKN